MAHYDMHNPAFNVRALVKELILLEDHLSCNEKQCRECIIKHALKSEAWAEEGLTLSPDAGLSNLFQSLLPRLNVLVNNALAGADCMSMAGEVRALRRELQKRLM